MGEDNDKIQINLAGMGIGDGWMSPYHNARYANFLYQVGLVDELDRDYCLAQEQTTQDLIDGGNLYQAWQSWNNEFGYFLTKMDCGYYYNIASATLTPLRTTMKISATCPPPGKLFTLVRCLSPTLATSTLTSSATTPAFWT